METQNEDLFVHDISKVISNKFDIISAIVNKFSSKKFKFYNVSNWEDINQLNEKVLPVLINVLDEEGIFLYENELTYNSNDLELINFLGFTDNKLVLLLKYLDRTFKIKLELDKNVTNEDILLAFKKFIVSNSIYLELFNSHINDPNQLFTRVNNWMKKIFQQSLIQINTNPVLNMDILKIIGIDSENLKDPDSKIQLFFNNNILINDIFVSYKIVASKEEIKDFFGQLFDFDLTENDTIGDFIFKLNKKLQNVFNKEKILERVKIIVNDSTEKLKQEDKIFATYKFKIIIDNDYVFETDINLKLKISFANLLDRFNHFFRQVFDFNQNENVTIIEFLNKLKTNLQQHFGSFLLQHLNIVLKNQIELYQKLMTKITPPKIAEGQLDVIIVFNLFSHLIDDSEKTKSFNIKFKITFSAIEIKKRINSFLEQTFGFNFNETNIVADLITKIKENIKVNFSDLILKRIEIISDNKTLKLHQLYQDVAEHKLTIKIDGANIFTKLVQTKITYSAAYIKQQLDTYLVSKVFDFNFNETNIVADLITKIKENIKVNFSDLILKRIEIISDNKTLKLHQPYKDVVEHKLTIKVDGTNDFVKLVQTKITYSAVYIKQQLNVYLGSKVFDFNFNETNIVADLITKIKENIKVEFSDLILKRIAIISSNVDDKLHQQYKDVVEHKLTIKVDGANDFVKLVQTRITYSVGYIKQQINDYLDSKVFDFNFNETNVVADLITKVKENIKVNFSDLILKRIEIISDNKTLKLHQPYKDVVEHKLAIKVDGTNDFVKLVQARIAYSVIYIKKQINDYLGSKVFEFSFNETNIVADLITKIKENIKVEFSDLILKRIEIISDNKTLKLHQPCKDVVEHKLTIKVDGNNDFVKLVQTRITYSVGYIKQQINDYLDSKVFDFNFNETNVVADLIAKIKENIKVNFSDLILKRIEIISDNKTLKLHQPYKDVVEHKLTIKIDAANIFTKLVQTKITYSAAYIKQQLNVYLGSKVFDFNFNETNIVADLIAKIKENIKVNFSDLILNRIAITSDSVGDKLHQLYKDIAQHNLKIKVDDANAFVKLVQTKITYSAAYIKQQLNVYLGSKVFEFNFNETNVVADLITKIKENIKVKFSDLILNRIAITSDSVGDKLHQLYKDVAQHNLTIKVDDANAFVKLVQTKIAYSVIYIKKQINDYLGSKVFDFNFNETNIVADLITKIKENIKVKFSDLILKRIAITSDSVGDKLHQSYKDVVEHKLAIKVDGNNDFVKLVQTRITYSVGYIKQQINDYLDSKVFDFNFNETNIVADLITKIKENIKANFSDLILKRIEIISDNKTLKLHQFYQDIAQHDLMFVIDGLMGDIKVINIKTKIYYSSNYILQQINDYLNSRSFNFEFNEKVTVAEWITNLKQNIKSKFSNTISNRIWITANNINSESKLNFDNKGNVRLVLTFSADNQHHFNKILLFAIKFTDNELASRLLKFLNQRFELNLSTNSTLKDTLQEFKIKLIDQFGSYNANRISTNRENDSTKITPNDKGEDSWNLNFYIDGQSRFNKNLAFKILFTAWELRKRLEVFLDIRFKLNLSEKSNLRDTLQEFKIKLIDQFGSYNANRISTNREYELTKVEPNDKGEGSWNLNFYIDNKNNLNKNLNFTVWFSKEFLKDKLWKFLDQRHSMTVYQLPTLKKVLEHFSELLKNNFGIENANRISTNRQNDETVSKPNLRNGEDQWWLEFWVDYTFFFRKNLLIKIILWA